MQISSRVRRHAPLPDASQHNASQHNASQHNSSQHNASLHNASLHGFTLVELLVVIAIIGVLVALLLPAIQAAREAARRSQCQNNLKQVGLASLNYASAHAGELPPGGVTNGPCCGTRSNESWSISILPQLELQNLYNQYDFTLINIHPKNLAVLRTSVPAYLCPSDEETDVLERPESGPGKSFAMARGSYRANTGRCGDPPVGWWDSPGQTANLNPSWAGPFHAFGTPPVGFYRNANSPANLRQITDGLSNTLFFGEMTSRASTSNNATLIRATLRRRTFWGYTYTSYNKSCVVPQTRTLLVDFGRCIEVSGPGGSNPCKRAWGSLHPGGLHFTFGDGSVRFLQTSIDMQIFAGMATMAGEELIDL